MDIYSDTRLLLKEIGMPSGDMSFPSDKVFSNGEKFRIEVPTVNSYFCAKKIILSAENRNLKIHRITETKGMFRHTKSEIKNYVSLTQDHSIQLLMSVGPRATYDTSATAKTVEGNRIGYRLRGQEQIIRAIEDIYRGLELGVKGFVIYDEGLLWTLNELRKKGSIPKDTHFKVSAHCGHCNPASIKLLESIGADSINPVRDLSVDMLSAIRSVVEIPLDCHIDNPTKSGGFIRTYEAPEIVRVASPVYLKTGNGALSGHGVVPTESELDLMIDQVEIVTEFVNKYQ